MTPSIADIIREAMRDPDLRPGSEEAPVPTSEGPIGIAPLRDTVPFSNFEGLDIRVGTILRAERIPKSDFLLKLNVSFGDIGERQILAGLAESYDPEQIVGYQVTAVINIEPRKIRDIESQGMILAASGEDGKACLVYCPGAVDGATVG